MTLSTALQPNIYDIVEFTWRQLYWEAFAISNESRAWLVIMMINGECQALQMSKNSKDGQIYQRMVT